MICIADVWNRPYSLLLLLLQRKSFRETIEKPQSNLRRSKISSRCEYFQTLEIHRIEIRSNERFKGQRGAQENGERDGNGGGAWKGRIREDEAEEL